MSQLESILIQENDSSWLVKAGAFLLFLEEDNVVRILQVDRVLSKNQFSASVCMNSRGESNFTNTFPEYQQSKDLTL